QTGMCYIGTHTGGTSYFDEGVLDEIRIYDRALSASEITQLYNLGRGM
ncbi:LamG domain-containing protein, partial [Candidatus Gracilibacteria bacterium]|nr:LamG domain-containing protein [Candidatus Gracilibacteria bacterium]MCF7819588.1 LamG domain-containing protein [Candidatus Gracilibacteria bacterium]